MPPIIDKPAPEPGQDSAREQSSLGEPASGPVRDTGSLLTSLYNTISDFGTFLGTCLRAVSASTSERELPERRPITAAELVLSHDNDGRKLEDVRAIEEVFARLGEFRGQVERWCSDKWSNAGWNPSGWKKSLDEQDAVLSHLSKAFALVELSLDQFKSQRGPLVTQIDKCSEHDSRVGYRYDLNSAIVGFAEAVERALPASIDTASAAKLFADIHAGYATLSDRVKRVSESSAAEGAGAA